ncbi:recombination protein RecR [Candidatus Shapirobacteria bacterium]|nr:recombination protein RecR [Candidatus Shapirobacteria bacterium]
MKIPKAINNLIEAFEQLPGIGPKTAARLTFYLLHTPQEFLEQFGETVVNLKKETKECSVCHNIGETDPCEICADLSRDQSIICAVEQPLDILSLERTNHYRGVYHVLGGVINPLQNISAEEIKIAELIRRVRENETIREVILATGSSLEGEATAMYIKKELEKVNAERVDKVRVSRVGQGLPVGADLEYADELTLERALEGRREY